MSTLLRASGPNTPAIARRPVAGTSGAARSATAAPGSELAVVGGSVSLRLLILILVPPQRPWRGVYGTVATRSPGVLLSLPAPRAERRGELGGCERREHEDH